MEKLVFQNIVEYLLMHRFRTKKDMACEIGISYRILLNCYAGKGTHQAMNIVSAKLLRYCIVNRIALGDAISLPV